MPQIEQNFTVEPAKFSRCPVPEIAIGHSPPNSPLAAPSNASRPSQKLSISQSDASESEATLIDPLHEELLSLREAATLCPRRRGGKRPHVSCLYRWTTSGVRGVKLESMQVGATRCTTREALSRFFQRLSGNPAGVLRPSPDRSIAELNRELDREGL